MALAQPEVIKIGSSEVNRRFKKNPTINRGLEGLGNKIETRVVFYMNPGITVYYMIHYLIMLHLVGSSPTGSGVI